ncbi:NlpC/P60 family protein [Clostridium vincentii]|uniref:Putative endopeptidase p60 n=1 Tax=Clostridium vincentii TaxID=52704 RepID=A0A2T0BKD3_9CLOT|nr:C40 family peptidase [Clostridium vincentii]PRR84262.1 putative endopeptidase p60 precursor [Clostridium vincentii]
MKKKVLSTVIAAIIIITSITSTGFVANATPATEAGLEYDELSEKVRGLEEQVQAIDAQISPLVDKINSNNSQVQNINTEIEQTNVDIVQAKVDISEKEEVLGKRLREVYKTGGQTSYVSLLFSADSFGDLISKVDSASRIVNIDKKVVVDLTENKDKLDTQVASLETKANEIVKLNEEVEAQKLELDNKKAEQQPIVDQAIAEKAEFDKLYLSVEERKIVSGYIDTCNNADSSAEELRSTIATLRSIRDNQPLKSLSVRVDVDAAIENAKVAASLKEEASAQAVASAKAVEVNRGGTTVSGDTSGIVNYAMQFLGTPYVYGATGPSVFDCSGFTQYVYRNAGGSDISRTTFTQINKGKSVSQSELQPGDLVFPSTHHVGIYIGNGNMIHAPQTGDVVKISKVYSFYAARRILN